MNTASLHLHENWINYIGPLHIWVQVASWHYFIHYTYRYADIYNFYAEVVHSNWTNVNTKYVQLFLTNDFNEQTRITQPYNDTQPFIIIIINL